MYDGDTMDLQLLAEQVVGAAPLAGLLAWLLWPRSEQPEAPVTPEEQPEEPWFRRSA